MYEIFVRVHEVSWLTPGIISKNIFRRAMRKKWISQAPGKEHVSKVMRSNGDKVE